ncbi:uncharacterized protein LOC128894123 [Hylaeus anthracinus]|uniref:uncharacterized protein LOC128894123 n=1 Tax=Hylaeus anthracinus TaxID=313031 RepID=UPI0023B89F4C|nr:uncharacterized protein LOC128894123 [Hylaeus anthracinus]
MIVATHKCGCPPKEKPPCSPCCASRERAKGKRPARSGWPEKPEIVVPTCCPIKPEDTSPYSSRKIRSEIVDAGLPYKELEAVINDNRLVIRTQKEPVKEEYEPPCDCVEDPRPGRTSVDRTEQMQSSGNRTVTLYPRVHSLDESLNSDEETDEESETAKVRSTLVEENPNIFLLRVKKRSRRGQNIDLEFRIPRPWSTKKRMEYCKDVYRPPVDEETRMAVSEVSVDARNIQGKARETEKGKSISFETKRKRK